MPVVAAGAILWRKEKGVLKVLMIHRSRYDDWSWPKGKLDKGEAVSEAAVRELKEETGLKVSLGVKLFVSEYKLDNGAKKVVHYWSAQVTDEAIRKQKFKPDDEVSTFEWLSVEDAKKRMTYKHDNEPLKVLIALNEKNQLDTRPFIVLRHAKATPRTEWSKGEATRPLLNQGAIQAVALRNILNAYGPKLVVTSSWKRCLDTVLPFIAKHKIKLVERSQLSELGAKNGPQRTVKLVNNLVLAEKRVVVCSHRPALPTIIEALGAYGDKAQRKELEEALILKPADMCVVHLAKGTGKKKAKIVGIEFEGPASWDQSFQMTTSPAAWLTWLEARNKNFANPTGFLSITNLVWLTHEPQTIQGISGSWWAEGDKVFVNDSNTGNHSWNIEPRGEISFDYDGMKVELASRNGQLVVRPRDPNNAMLQSFEGVITFDYNAEFCVTATLEASDAPREVVVGSVVEGMTHAYISPGALVFSIEGNEYRLTAFDKANSEDLTVYYKDATSGNITYGTGKSVNASHQEDGSYILDFNYSGNFPCSYTDFATCPVSPVENKLPIAIEAGEKKPLYRNTVEGIQSQVAK